MLVQLVSTVSPRAEAQGRVAGATASPSFVSSNVLKTAECWREEEVRRVQVGVHVRFPEEGSLRSLPRCGLLRSAEILKCTLSGGQLGSSGAGLARVKCGFWKNLPRR